MKKKQDKEKDKAAPKWKPDIPVYATCAPGSAADMASQTRQGLSCLRLLRNLRLPTTTPCRSLHVGLHHSAAGWVPALGHRLLFRPSITSVRLGTRLVLPIAALGAWRMGPIFLMQQSFRHFFKALCADCLFCLGYRGRLLPAVCQRTRNRLQPSPLTPTAGPRLSILDSHNAGTEPALFADAYATSCEEPGSTRVLQYSHCDKSVP
jgi:hypothetical protein